MAQTIDRQQARHGASSTVEKRRVKTSEENERRSNSLHGPSKLVRALNDFEEVTTRASDFEEVTTRERDFFIILSVTKYPSTFGVHFTDIFGLSMQSLRLGPFSHVDE